MDYAAYDAKKAGFGKVVYIIRKDIEKDFRERLFDRVARNFDAEYVFQTPDALLTPEEFSLTELTCLFESKLQNEKIKRRMYYG